MLKRQLIIAICSAAALLAGCSMGGGTGTGLNPGLSARMDQPGATLDRAAALAIVNHYRATAGAPALRSDSQLDSQAQTLSAAYASSGRAPGKPADVVGIRASAGYTNFADTFSGWRSSPADAAVLADRSATRAGIAVTFNTGSEYGTHWVLVLDN